MVTLIYVGGNRCYQSFHGLEIANCNSESCNVLELGNRHDLDGSHYENKFLAYEANMGTSFPLHPTIKVEVFFESFWQV